MDFIYISNISSNLDNSELFIEKVIGDLHNIENIWEPAGKATRHGFQSRPSVNLFENPFPRMVKLRSIISNEIDLYHSTFSSEQCDFIKMWPLKKKIHGWFVILKRQGYQNEHIHPSGWLSGVIYLKVVPPHESAEGAIEFSTNGQYYSHASSPKLIHQPKLGDIVLFPSSLHHRTIPFSTQTDRIIVSFDLVPQMSVGKTVINSHYMK